MLLSRDPSQSRPPPNIALRLWSLVGVHLLLAALPITEPALRSQMSISSWELLSPLRHLQLGPLLLLAFWGGFGTSSLSRRLLGIVVGLAYLATCEMSRAQVSEHYFYHLRSMMLPAGWPYTVFFQSFGQIALLVGLAAGAMLIVRHFIAALTRLEGDYDRAAKPPQLSLRHLFGTTAVVAVFLGLARSAPRSVFGCMASWAEQGLSLFASLTATLIVIWATLSHGAWLFRAAGACMLALLAGVAYSHAVACQRIAIPVWELEVRGLAEITLPVWIVAASLLVVRSCGYRLIPANA